MTRSVPVAVLVVALVTLAGCTRPAADGALVVLAASSLVDVTDALVDAWDGEALVSEAGSQVLAAQIRGGADADLLLLADPAVAAALAAEGFAADPVVVAANQLAIVVHPDAAAAVTTPADLADAELRVVLADAGMPLGTYTRRALAGLESSGRVPAGTADAVLAGADSFEDAARVVLAKVASGEADAAVVYRTDAIAAGRDVVTRAWPADGDVRIRYVAQEVDGARPAAADLLAFLTSDTARDVWRRHGFLPADPDRP
jgi:molybdate transport system substrate-binding protein